MILFDHALQQEYAIDDSILKGLQRTCQARDEIFVSHQWLLASLPKRMIYHYLYGDLLQLTAQPHRVLDVGGGYCSLSRLMIHRHHYTLLDIMAHNNHDVLIETEKSLGKLFWQNSDWYQFETQHKYDVIIANDLFPNVDQRLALFIDKFLPLCHEMRLSLTYYNTPRFYPVKRLDGDEIFYILAWDGEQVKRVLEKYIACIVEPQLDLLLENPPSLFVNQRQVCLVILKGQ